MGQGEKRGLTPFVCLADSFMKIGYGHFDIKRNFFLI